MFVCNLLMLCLGPGSLGHSLNPWRKIASFNGWTLSDGDRVVAGACCLYRMKQYSITYVQMLTFNPKSKLYGVCFDPKKTQIKLKLGLLIRFEDRWLTYPTTLSLNLILNRYTTGWGTRRHCFVVLVNPCLMMILD